METERKFPSVPGKRRGKCRACMKKQEFGKSKIQFCTSVPIFISARQPPSPPRARVASLRVSRRADRSFPQAPPSCNLSCDSRARKVCRRQCPWLSAALLRFRLSSCREHGDRQCRAAPPRGLPGRLPLPTSRWGWEGLLVLQAAAEMGDENVSPRRRRGRNDGPTGSGEFLCVELKS
jgi:hypothetical protein